MTSDKKRCKKCGTFNIIFTGNYKSGGHDFPMEERSSPIWKCLECGIVADYYDQEAWCYRDEYSLEERR